MKNKPEIIGKEVLFALPTWVRKTDVAGFPIEIISNTLTYPGESVAREALKNFPLVVGMANSYIAGNAESFRKILNDMGVARLYVMDCFPFAPLNYVTARGYHGNGSPTDIYLEFSRKIKKLEKAKINPYEKPKDFTVHGNWMADIYKVVGDKHENLYGVNLTPRFLFFKH